MTPRVSHQRNVFLEGEGDLWLSRNYNETSLAASRYVARDPVLAKLKELPLATGSSTEVLEVGCGQGLRLLALNQQFGWSVNGLDPSKKAIKELQSKGVSSYVGTANKLPFAGKSLDLLIFGFCLYLCDRDDLFDIASEANRVLKDTGWIVIYDFWSPSTVVNTYKHCEGVYSYKGSMHMMFEWHPSYSVFDHSVRHHEHLSYTDEASDWVATTVIRKLSQFV